MEENTQQVKSEDLDDRIQKVLHHMAATLYAYKRGEKSGYIRFEAMVTDGNIEGNVRIRVEEDI